MGRGFVWPLPPLLTHGTSNLKLMDQLGEGRAHLENASHKNVVEWESSRGQGQRARPLGILGAAFLIVLPFLLASIRVKNTDSEARSELAFLLRCLLLTVTLNKPLHLFELQFLHQ